MLLPRQTGRKRCPPSPPCVPFGSNNLSQESKGDDGVQSQPCLRLSLLTPPMTLTRAMGRRGPHFGSDTKSILAKPVSDLTPQLITHVETTAAPLSTGGRKFVPGYVAADFTSCSKRGASLCSSFSTV